MTVDLGDTITHRLRANASGFTWRLFRLLYLYLSWRRLNFNGVTCCCTW